MAKPGFDACLAFVTKHFNLFNETVVNLEIVAFSLAGLNYYYACDDSVLPVNTNGLPAVNNLCVEILVHAYFFSMMMALILEVTSDADATLEGILFLEAFMP
jgi:hypothetical protein